MSEASLYTWNDALRSAFLRRLLTTTSIERRSNSRRYRSSASHGGSLQARDDSRNAGDAVEGNARFG